MHKTRTPLRLWFAAAYLMGRDKRGVSAIFLARELGLRYETALPMAHKLRHGLTERHKWSFENYVEINETFVDGHGDDQLLQQPLHPMPRARIEYWRSIKPADRLPGRQHFEPMLIPHLLSISG